MTGMKAKAIAKLRSEWPLFTSVEEACEAVWINPEKDNDWEEMKNSFPLTEKEVRDAEQRFKHFSPTSTPIPKTWGKRPKQFSNVSTARPPIPSRRIRSGIL